MIHRRSGNSISSTNSDTGTFVILDDISRDRFPLMQENLVKCEWLDGFTEERLQVAGEVLDDSSSIR